MTILTIVPSPTSVSRVRDAAVDEGHGFAATLGPMSEQTDFSKLHQRVCAPLPLGFSAPSIGGKCIDAEMLNRIKKIADLRCRGWGGRLMEFNGEADHVHLLIALPP